MKKIKLGELLHIKRGASLSGKYYAATGDRIRLTLGNFDYPRGGFKPNTSKDNLYFVGDIKAEFILNKGDIITPLTEQVPGLLGETAIIPESNKYIQSGDIGLVVIDDQSRLSNTFAYYLLSTDIVKNQLGAGAQQTKIRHTTPEKIMDCYVWLPEYDQQIAISSLLDSLNQKIIINRKINDNLEQQMCLIFENILDKAQLNNIQGKNITVNEICQIITGKEDANFATSNGRYKFFTCSQDVLKCNDYAFNAPSILIAGNGDFNVKHYSEKFNAYQRTYVKKKKKQYYALLYLSCLYRINSLKKSSAGSIVKFITKNDIESIPVFIPDDTSWLHLLNKLIYLQEQVRIENEQLIALRDWLLPLLMNGQAIVAN